MSRTRHQPDYTLAALIAVLLLFGLVMLSSAGAVLGFQRYGDSNYFLKKQAISIGIGLVVAFITYSIDYRFWKKWSFVLFIMTIILLVVVFLPGIGSYFFGARRWINLGVTLFQPSELAKLTIILYLSAWFEQREHILSDARKGLLPYLITLGGVAGLVMLEPDLGTTMVIVLVSIVLFFSAGGAPRHILALAGVGLGMLALIIKIAPYRAQRFTVFLNPDLDPQGIGYHINQAWIALGSGGWFGLGLGHSRQKFNYLPEPAGDSIFAITAEELGFIPSALFVAAWVAFMYRGLSIARQTTDQFGKLVATGIVTWFGLQALMNMAALTGLLPLTGIPLPFMSNGGSAMIVNLAAVGILLNISRHANVTPRAR